MAGTGAAERAQQSRGAAKQAGGHAAGESEAQQADSKAAGEACWFTACLVSTVPSPMHKGLAPAVPTC